MYEADSRHTWDLDEVRQFPLDDRDLVISGFPKSGTNWMQVMLSNLWDDWTTTRNEYRRVPNISGRLSDDYEGYESCISCDPPRLMKTHLPRELFPSRWPEHGKVVHITRNPKDVCVSYFANFSRLGDVPSFAGSPQITRDFEEYLEQFLRGEVLYGPYLDNVLSWRDFEHPNLLKVTYEEARADVRWVLQRIIEFVGKPVDDDRIDRVIAETEFEAMRKNSEVRNQINVPKVLHEEKDGGPVFLRSGTVGDWKNGLTVAMSERIDDELVAPLEEHGVNLRYG